MSGFQSKKAMSKDKLTPQPKTEKWFITGLNVTAKCV